MMDGLFLGKSFLLKITLSRVATKKTTIKLILIFSLTESTKMEANDFIIFKHGCGNDSTYHEPHSIEFSEEAKQRFEKPGENFILIHTRMILSLKLEREKGLGQV